MPPLVFGRRLRGFLGRLWLCRVLLSSSVSGCLGKCAAVHAAALVWSLGIVQRNAITPTGSRCGRCCTRGIPGPAESFGSTRLHARTSAGSSETDVKELTVRARACPFWARVESTTTRVKNDPSMSLHTLPLQSAIWIQVSGIVDASRRLCCRRLRATELFWPII